MPYPEFFVAPMREELTRLGIEELRSVSDVDAAVARTLELRPDVVLMDLNLPRTPGLEATRRIAAAAPGTAVLVLTMLADDASVVAAMRMGASGYLLKESGQDEVLAAIRTVAAGGVVVGPGLAARLLDRPAPGAAQRV